MAEDERIEFYASFPDIQSAIKSSRDGARIQLDIPASELSSIVRLVALQHQAKLLKVTIAVADDAQNLGKLGDETTQETKGSPAVMDLRRSPD